MAANGEDNHPITGIVEPSSFEPYISSIFAFAPVVFGFLLGLLAALVVRIWQARIDEHTQRYNDIRRTLLGATEIATAYWLKLDDLPDRKAEAKLVGLYVLLNGLVVEVAAAYNDNPEVHFKRLQTFFEFTTGGDQYEVDTRQPDPARARGVQSEAAKLVLYFQKYRRRKLTMGNSLRIGLFRR